MVNHVFLFRAGDCCLHHHPSVQHYLRLVRLRISYLPTASPSAPVLALSRLPLNITWSVSIPVCSPSQGVFNLGYP